jgi:hypothetical protein
MVVAAGAISIATIRRAAAIEAQGLGCKVTSSFLQAQTFVP